MFTQSSAAAISLGLLYHAKQRHRTAPGGMAMADRSVQPVACPNDLLYCIDVPHAANHAAGRYGSRTAEDDAVHHAFAARCIHMESVGRTEPLLGRWKHH